MDGVRGGVFTESGSCSVALGEATDFVLDVVVVRSSRSSSLDSLVSGASASTSTPSTVSSGSAYSKQRRIKALMLPRNFSFVLIFRSFCDSVAFIGEAKPFTDSVGVMAPSNPRRDRNRRDSDIRKMPSRSTLPVPSSSNKSKNKLIEFMISVVPLNLARPRTSCCKVISPCCDSSHFPYSRCIKSWSAGSGPEPHWDIVLLRFLWVRVGLVISFPGRRRGVCYRPP